MPKQHQIVSILACDLHFPLAHGDGTDALHSGAEYAFATTRLRSDHGLEATGIVLTLGAGNKLVCEAIELLGEALAGREIEELMSEFGVVSEQLAQHPQLRWLGPHKGVVHLALASITNACFDLWAKARGIPLWRLLLDLTPKQLRNLLDLSYLQEVLPGEEAETIFNEHLPSRPNREGILQKGYPGYDTSVGWFQYEDSRVTQLAQRAMERGFHAF
jgi:L-fuconate dehydratase